MRRIVTAAEIIIFLDENRERARLSQQTVIIVLYILIHIQTYYAHEDTTRSVFIYTLYTRYMSTIYNIGIYIYTHDEVPLLQISVHPSR